ncbi:hypothetical protein M9458_028877, partial [Cirrhinus mrigala]
FPQDPPEGELRAPAQEETARRTPWWTELLMEPLGPRCRRRCEVELSEQCIAIEALSEDAPSQNATERLPVLQDALKAAPLLVKREESRVSYGDVGMAIENGMEGGALLPQIKADATHLVAIIPNQ